MADEIEVTAEDRVEALGLGWVDKDAFKGAPEKWVDANTFLERGRTVMPILKKQNAGLHAELQKANLKIAEMDARDRATQAAIHSLQESHDADTQERVKEARAALLAEIKAAKKDDDTDREVDLTDQLMQLDSAARTAAAKKPDVKPAADDSARQAAQQAAFSAWMAKPENAWYSESKAITGAALAIAEDLRQAGDTSLGDPFMEKVRVRLFKELGRDERPAHSKVEESRGSPSGGAGKAKTYADLPKEAKDYCDRFAPKVVGDGRAHKDIASWRSSYAQKYFQQEAVGR